MGGQHNFVARLTQKTCYFNPGKTTFENFGGRTALEELHLANHSVAGFLTENFREVMKYNGYSLEGVKS